MAVLAITVMGVGLLAMYTFLGRADSHEPTVPRPVVYDRGNGDEMPDCEDIKDSRNRHQCLIWDGKNWVIRS